ncbi:MAG: serine/threonine protein kinase, partial [Acidobacteriaceae bacterium]|nr:serine/threonine protein kinase [Acidobacteriaceae bacterium]
CGCCYTSPSTHCEADGSVLSLTLPIERVIDGKYRLERRIGSGGMGAVYQASDLRLDRVVAIKVMTGRLFGNNAALRRFEREARAAARLQHPNIVAIYDFGSLRGDGAYLVMQFVAGLSWRAEMLRIGQIRPVRAAGWFDQLCEAMYCAHASGVVHRDLKPENVLISGASGGMEKITVLDFGLAKLHALHQTHEPVLTTEDSVVGTYGYMSPEQRRGKTVDSATDIYAIAAMVAETLTNCRPPMSGASRKWLRRALRSHEPSPVVTELVKLLSRCMADLPGQRPTIQDLRRELIPLLRACPSLVNVNPVGTGSDAATIPI